MCVNVFLMQGLEGGLRQGKTKCMCGQCRTRLTKKKKKKKK